MRHLYPGTVLPLVFSPAFAPYAAEGRWQQTAGNCHVWDALPQPDEADTWSGDCVDGKASGRGTEVFRYRAVGV